MSIDMQVRDLIALVESGRMLDALKTHYAEDVEMQENTAAPTVGLAANLEREVTFYGSLASASFRAASVLVTDDRAAINWIFEFTTGSGERFRMDEVALSTWRDGKIVHERYVYDSATLAVAA